MPAPISEADNLSPRPAWLFAANKYWKAQGKADFDY